MSVVKDMDLEVMPTSIFLNGDDDDDEDLKIISDWASRWQMENWKSMSPSGK